MCANTTTNKLWIPKIKKRKKQPPPAEADANDLALCAPLPAAAEASPMILKMRGNLFWVVGSVSDLCFGIITRLESEKKAEGQFFVSYFDYNESIFVALDAITPLLSPHASRILVAPNAGGNSLISEFLAMEVLNVLFGAALTHTEMELYYEPVSKLTDFSVTIDGRYFGVSVTRAMKHRGLFTVDDGVRLLTKKLNGIRVSSENVVPKFRKQILFMWVQNKQVLNVLQRILAAGTVEYLMEDTVVLLTVAKRTTDFIFYNRLK